jgi:hypothetical protein
VQLEGRIVWPTKDALFPVGTDRVHNTRGIEVPTELNRLALPLRAHQSRGSLLPVSRHEGCTTALPFKTMNWFQERKKTPIAEASAARTALDISFNFLLYLEEAYQDSAEYNTVPFWETSEEICEV